MPPFGPLIASLYYYAIVFAICELGRRIGRSLVTSSQQRILVNEFFGTLQLCAMAYENGLILRHYGLPGFFLIVAASVIVHTFTMTDAYGSPCAIFEESTTYRRTSASRNQLLIRLIAQVAAAVAAFRLARLIWGIGFMDDHSSLAKTYKCSSDLHVPILHGIFYEAAAAFAYRFLWLKVHEHVRQWPVLLDAVVVPTIVVLGLSKTGMYFNPILAFSLNYGCKGTTPLDHFLVYWLGPIVGWMLASEVDHRTKFRRGPSD